MKKKLVENFIVSSNSYNKLDESSIKDIDKTLTVFTEKGDKKEYKAEAIYTFPISKPGEKNLNERVYPISLWENVIKKKMGESSSGLMDHPENEGSTKDEWCIWRNIRFSEDKKLILADAYLFGKWGRQVKEKLEAGGQVGLSSSGFGEFEEDGITISSSTYELERVADHVLNPSYQVFGTNEDKKESLEQEKEENLEEGTTIKKEEKQKEDKNMLEDKGQLSSFEEKSFKLNIKSSLKEIKVIEDPAEKISSLKDILSYFEDGVAEDLKEEINSLIEEEENNLFELAKKGTNVDSLVEDSLKGLKEELENLKSTLQEKDNEVTFLTEKLTSATELLDSFKVYGNKIKEMLKISEAEKNSKIDASEYKEAIIYIEDLEEKVELAEQEVKELKKESSILKRKLSASKTFIGKVEEKSDDEGEGEEEEESIEPTLQEEYPRASKEVISYYEDLVYATPAVEKIKEEILNSKTLLEAQRNYLRLKSLLYSEGFDSYPTNRKTKTREESDKEFVENSKIKKMLSIREGWK